MHFSKFIPLLAFCALGCSRSETQQANTMQVQAPSTFSNECKYETPRSGRWQVARGMGHGTNKADAIREAQENARQNLLQSLALKCNQAKLALLSSKVDVSYYQPTYEVDLETACTFAFLSESEIEAVDAQFKKASEELDASLKNLRTSLQKERGNSRLCVDLPSSEKGGDAGSVAFRLKARVLESLNGMTLSESNCQHLGGYLSMDGAQCAFTPFLSDGEKTKSFQKVTFSPLALGVKSCEERAASTLSDRSMGFLPGGRKTGSTGLEVSFGMSAVDSQMELCAGEEFVPTLSTNLPAKVRLYSVAEDGRVMLDFETEANGEVKLPPMVAVQLKPGLKYRMVAVAVPAGTTFGHFEPSVAAGSPSACMGTKGLHVSDFPEVAAFAALNHGVRELGSTGCPNDEKTRSVYSNVLSFVSSIDNCK